MACDIGGDGSIYIVWTNIGVPGVNTGNDIDVYMVRSSDEGESWSAPIRVNPVYSSRAEFQIVICKINGIYIFSNFN
jgi:hypothetical protein